MVEVAISFLFLLFFFFFDKADRLYKSSKNITKRIRKKNHRMDTYSCVFVPWLKPVLDAHIHSLVVMHAVSANGPFWSNCICRQQHASCIFVLLERSGSESGIPVAHA